MTKLNNSPLVLTAVEMWIMSCWYSLSQREDPQPPSPHNSLFRYNGKELDIVTKFSYDYFLFKSTEVLKDKLHNL